MATLNASNSTTQEPLDDRLKRLPPFHAVFEAGGPPSSSALQLYLANLDNTLEENSRQLDSCLQGLLRFTNDLPGERTFASPKDGLLHMYNSHVLEKDSCYDPETEEAIIILDALPTVWMEALFSILDPLLDKILEPMLLFLLKEKSPDAPRDGSVASRLQDLPCGCQSNAAEMAATWPSHHAVPAKDLVRRCLELLIESTQQNMYSLSGPVCILFHTLQAACTQRNIKTPHSCVGVQMLAWSMWRKMKNVEGMQTMVGLPLLPHHQHHLSLLADFYYQIMVFGKDSTAARQEETTAAAEQGSLKAPEPQSMGNCLYPTCVLDSSALSEIRREERRDEERGSAWVWW